MMRQIPINKAENRRIVFLRRLFRFTKDPRYRPYHFHPASPDDCYDIVAVRFFLADLFVRPEVSRDLLWRQVSKEFFDSVEPRLEWRDWIGNGLFLVACASVLLWVRVHTWLGAPLIVTALSSVTIRGICAAQHVRAWDRWLRVHGRSAAESSQMGLPSAEN
jgi:hypothetical protein